MEALYVAIGAAVGGVSRWAINRLLVAEQPSFPLSTLTVNVISSFLAGVFFSLVLYRQPDNNFVKPLLITGFCGGFSTMSSLSLECLQLFSQGRLFLGIINIIANVLLCILATWMGSLCFK